MVTTKSNMGKFIPCTWCGNFLLTNSIPLFHSLFSIYYNQFLLFLAGLVTSCIPSIFANQQTSKKIGHQYVAGNHVAPVFFSIKNLYIFCHFTLLLQIPNWFNHYQVFQGQLNDVIHENPTQQLTIKVGNFVWVVPIHNGYLHYPTLEQFIDQLGSGYSGLTFCVGLRGNGTNHHCLWLLLYWENLRMVLMYEQIICIMRLYSAIFIFQL